MVLSDWHSSAGFDQDPQAPEDKHKPIRLVNWTRLDLQRLVLISGT